MPEIGCSAVALEKAWVLPSVKAEIQRQMERALQLEPGAGAVEAEYCTIRHLHQDEGGEWLLIEPHYHLAMFAEVADA